VRLGWRWSRPNDFTSPDHRPLRDTFGHLQHTLTWPHFRIERAADQVVASGATYTVVWDTQVEDPWNLWRSGSSVQVPHDWNEWWFVGVAGVHCDLLSGASRRVLGIYVNGVIDPGGAQATYPNSVNGGLRANTSIQVPLKKTDTLAVRYTNNAAADDALTHATFSGYFLPRV